MSHQQALKHKYSAVLPSSPWGTNAQESHVWQLLQWPEQNKQPIHCVECLWLSFVLMTKPKTPTDITYRHPTATAHLLPNMQSLVKKVPLTFLQGNCLKHFTYSKPRMICNVAHSPVLEGWRPGWGQMNTQHMRSVTHDGTSQPCRAGPSPGILELGLRTLLMAGRLPTGVRVWPGVKGRPFTAVSSVSTYEKAAQCKRGLLSVHL